MPSPLRWPDAALAGLASSMRTTAGPAALAARGRISGRARTATLLACAGELAQDKLPVARDRIEPPAVGGRVVAGAYTGRAIAGPAGLVAGALGAFAGTYASWRARKLAGAWTGLPDPALAVGEDVIALTTAAVATRPDPSPGAGEPFPVDGNGAEPEAHPPRPSLLRRLGVGLAAGVAGTAAMTIAQGAEFVLTAAEPSDSPARVADKLKRAAGLGRLKRSQRPAANQGLHWLFGVSWGLPYGLLAGGGTVAPELSGPAFGLVVWGAALAHQPALGLADVPWKRSPASLGSEALFHLVYGIGLGGAARALRA